MIAGINEILNENPALTALIGANKIYPMVVSIDVQPPYIATSLSSVGPTNVKGEVSDMDYPLINVNLHTDNYDDLETISEAIRQALDNIFANTDAGYNFAKIWFANAFDRPDLYTVDRPLYARSIQFFAQLKR